MKILVTGGLGFIGSHTVVELQNKGYQVVIIDNLSNASLDVLEGIFAITGRVPIFEKLDLKDKSSVQAFFKVHQDIQGIIHFAASKAVGESVVNPLMYYENWNSDTFKSQSIISRKTSSKLFSSHKGIPPIEAT